MAYTGATQAAEARTRLGKALEVLQDDPDLPEDVLNVAQNIAKAVGALFEAEHASSELDGRASVRHAMGSLSQTLALLQDVRSEHAGIGVATKTLADVMAGIYPLSTTPSRHPGPPTEASVTTDDRKRLEANVGATTESNFYVGFSGEISDGGVFVATYHVLPKATAVEVLITLPGGYETRVPGRVRFTRDPMDFSLDQEPGMGIQFEHLSSEARELVLRFIRKRPPMFFDD